METFTKKKFSDLTKTEQVIRLVEDGKEILTREEEGFDIHLYLLSDLYIELWYESNTKKIVRVEITDVDSVIKNYKEIDMSDIV